MLPPAWRSFCSRNPLVKGFNQLVESAKGFEQRLLLWAQQPFELLAQPLLGQALRQQGNRFQPFVVFGEGAIEAIVVCLVFYQQAAGELVELLHIDSDQPGCQCGVQVQQLAQAAGELVAAQVGKKVDQHGSAAAPGQKGELLEEMQILLGLEQGAI